MVLLLSSLSFLWTWFFSVCQCEVPHDDIPMRTWSWGHVQCSIGLVYVREHEHVLPWSGFQLLPCHPLTSIDIPVLPPPAPLSSAHHPHGKLDLDNCVQQPDWLFGQHAPYCQPTGHHAIFWHFYMKYFFFIFYDVDYQHAGSKDWHQPQTELLSCHFLSILHVINCICNL